MRGVLLLIVFILSAAAYVETKKCHINCVETYEPVCGNDGITYPSECMMDYFACETGKEIVVAAKGKCQRNCDFSCGNEGEPVCGDDSKMYPNHCKMKLQSCKSGQIITALPKERCLKDECTYIKCPEVYDPVCGDDEKTYSNECMMNWSACKQRKKIALFSKGRCTPAFETEENRTLKSDDGCHFIKCLESFDLVCGDDHNTYANQCMMNWSACKQKKTILLKFKGRCEQVLTKEEAENTRVDKCDYIKCPEVHNPVCGSNGQTYSNECMMNWYACIQRKSITVHHRGECVKRCDFKCKELNVPVCGNDGKMYTNICMMRLESCRTGRPINIVRKHNCLKDKCDYLKCHEVHDPVCGDDNQTYPNKCMLDWVACTQNKQTTVVHKGECRENSLLNKDETENLTDKCKYITCSGAYDPVCGDNGQTYSNECMMEFSACKEMKAISLAYKGSCFKEHLRTAAYAQKTFGDGKKRRNRKTLITTW